MMTSPAKYQPPQSEAEFLMEQLLDSQEEVAKLQGEVAKWKAAVLLRNAASDALDAPHTSDDVTILQALRASLKVSLEQIDRDIQRTATTRRTDDDATDTSATATPHRGSTSDAYLLFPKLRHELLLFRNVSELERLYRTGIRIGFDASRILRLALEKLAQLTNQWALLTEQPQLLPRPFGASSLPSYCFSKEWAIPFRRALMEVVIALEMLQSPSSIFAAPPRQATMLRGGGGLLHTEEVMLQLRIIAEHEDELLELVENTSDFDTDSIRERIKQAASTASLGAMNNSSTSEVSVSAKLAASSNTSRSASAHDSVTPDAATSSNASAQPRSTSPRKKAPRPAAKLSYLQSIQLGNKRSSSSSSASRASPSASNVTNVTRHQQQQPQQQQQQQQQHQTVTQQHHDASLTLSSGSHPLLPPRVPGGLSTPVAAAVAARSSSVECMPASSGRSLSANPSDSRTASPSNISGAGRGPVVGRTTPTKPIDVPRRVVLKSPSPKPKRTLHGADVPRESSGLPVDLAAAVVVQDLPKTSPPRSALKHNNSVSPHCREGESWPGEAIRASPRSTRAEGLECDLSPRSPSTSPPQPLQYAELIHSRELSAEQPVRRREPQPTKVAPLTATPASLPSPGRQVRFAGDS